MNNTSQTIMAVITAMLLGLTARAGTLDPPGPPSSTMRTLDEIYMEVHHTLDRVVDTLGAVMDNEQHIQNLQQQVTDLQHRIDGMEQRMQTAGMLQMRGDMVLIPGGTNSGTNPLADGESYSANYPETYSLTVDSFYMDQYPVTKALWDDVRTWALENGYTDLPVGGGKGPDHPVHSVNWYDAVKWCNARSERDGLTPVYSHLVMVGGEIVWQVYRTGEVDYVSSGTGNGYRLPTDTEWEYAARGGVSGFRFPWDDANTIQHTRANYRSRTNEVYDTSSTRGYHETYETGGMPYTSPVGSFAPNGYGLYDMAGNVREWCWNASGSYRVGRGGYWNYYANDCRVAYRDYYSPGLEGYSLGFRLVRAAP